MTALAPTFVGIPRVDLLPKSEVARRERDRRVRGWVWGVLAAILVAMLIIAAAFAFKLLADQRLASEQARTNALLIEVASLADVSQAISTEADLTQFRAEAMATDLAWSPLVAKVQGVLPEDAAFTGFDFVVGGAPQGDDPTAEQGIVGTFTVDSPTPLDIVAIIRSLRGVEGVLFADGQSVTSSQVSEGHFAYLLNVQFDQTVYSGQYATTEEGSD